MRARVNRVGVVAADESQQERPCQHHCYAKSLARPELASPLPRWGSVQMRVAVHARSTATLGWSILHIRIIAQACITGVRCRGRLRGYEGWLTKNAPANRRKGTTNRLASLKITAKEAAESLSCARDVRCAVGYRFVQVHVAVANLEVESTIRVAAYPSLVMDWCPLASEIGQGEQAALGTYSAFRPSLLHGALLILPTRLI